MGIPKRDPPDSWNPPIPPCLGPNMEYLQGLIAHPGTEECGQTFSVFFDKPLSTYAPWSANKRGSMQQYGKYMGLKGVTISQPLLSEYIA